MLHLTRTIVGVMAVLGTAVLAIGQDPKNPVPAPATTPAAAAAVPTTVAVIDFAKVIEAYPKAAQEKKRLDEMRAALVAGLKVEEDKLKDLRLERDGFNPGTRERALKELEMDVALRRINGLRQVYEADLNEQFDKFLAQTYDEIEVAIAQCAKARGVQLVLRTHRDTTEDDSLSIKSRLQDRRIVWYAANEIDLTPHVIKLLQVPLAAPAAGK